MIPNSLTALIESRGLARRLGKLLLEHCHLLLHFGHPVL
jgi:hypothetical protein